MKDGKKNPRITPHDEDDDWDWRADQYKIQKELEEDKLIKNEALEEYNAYEKENSESNEESSQESN